MPWRQPARNKKKKQQPWNKKSEVKRNDNETDIEKKIRDAGKAVVVSLWATQDDPANGWRVGSLVWPFSSVTRRCWILQA